MENDDLIEIWQDEYTSLITSFNDTILWPINQEDKKLDRDTLSDVQSELEFKLKLPEFKQIPIKVQRAYQNLNILLNILKVSTDEQVESSKKVLYKLSELNRCCEIYGDSLSSINHGRDPCRRDKYELISELNELGENKLSIVEGAKTMLDTCKHCPYK